MLVCTALALSTLPGSTEPMNFSLAGTGGNCNGCEWVAAQGEITADTPAAFLAFLATSGKPYHIALHSLGGDLLAGIKLGELIRETGATTMIAETIQETGLGLEHIETTVPGICASACAFAFMGGVERLVSDEDRLGVHQFYSANDEAVGSELVQALVGLTLIHALRMGIDAGVIVAASGTSPNSIHWFDREEIVAFGLDTSSSRTEPWRMEPYKSGVVIATTHHESVRRSVDVTLFCRAQGRRWYVLISEQDEFYAANLKTDQIFHFTGQYPNRPTLRVGDDVYAVTARDIEFQRVSGDRLSVSVNLPASIASAGGRKLGFDPDFARVFNSLLRASVELPSEAWLKIADRNCI